MVLLIIIIVRSAVLCFGVNVFTATVKCLDRPFWIFVHTFFIWFWFLALSFIIFAWHSKRLRLVGIVDNSSYLINQVLYFYLSVCLWWSRASRLPHTTHMLLNDNVFIKPHFIHRARQSTWTIIINIYDHPQYLIIQQSVCVSRVKWIRKRLFVVGRDLF